MRPRRFCPGGSGSWLEWPGHCDITADVAFDQVQADHRAVVCSQADFLRAHGIDELVAEGRARWRERAGVGDLEALAARSRATEAAALLDPAGVGGFTVLEWTVSAECHGSSDRCHPRPRQPGWMLIARIAPDGADTFWD